MRTVSMPYRAKLHFYFDIYSDESPLLFCVNALSGQTSFLQYEEENDKNAGNVSMPYRAKLHFYP